MSDSSPLSLGSINRQTPWKARLLGKVLCLLGVLGIVGVLWSFTFPVVRSREPLRRSQQCKNNFKQIVIALHVYHGVYGALPPAYTVDANGKPLHSWRTLLLPFVDQAPLYYKVDFSKAWDDPANAEVYQTRIPVYDCPSARGPKGFTRYLACVGPNSCFNRSEPRRLSEITDGFASTLMVIEVDAEHAIHWMAPADADKNLLGIGPDSKLAHVGGMHAGFADGAIRFLSAKMPVEQRRALMSIAGNEPVGDL